MYLREQSCPFPLHALGVVYGWASIPGGVQMPFVRLGRKVVISEVVELPFRILKA